MPLKDMLPQALYYKLEVPVGVDAVSVGNARGLVGNLKHTVFGIDGEVGVFESRGYGGLNIVKTAVGGRVEAVAVRAEDSYRYLISRF